MSIQQIDLVVVVWTNLFNLIIVGLMLSRHPGWKKFEYYIGLLNIALILPLGIAVLFNTLNGRQWWTILLPGLLILYLLVELLLDYVFKFPFRQTRWLGPYLGLFYLAQWMMIGYAFAAARRYGFITLLTYFISLGATAYSYRKVGHGTSTNPEK
jgi:CDP-diglyceride synthetase